MRGTPQTRTIDGVEYAPGRQFRVIAPGGSLDGMVSSGPSAWTGWRQELRVGDVITCRGYHAGFGSDPGYGIHWNSAEADAAGAGAVEFRPSAGGVFNYYPQGGFLEPLEGSET